MPATTIILRRSAALLSLLALFACGGDGGGGTEPPPENPITRVEVTPSSQSVDIDQTVGFNATVFRRDGAQASVGVSWSSSDPSIATIDQNGQATGVDDGSVTITAAVVGAASVTGTATLTVTDPNPPAPVTGVSARVVSDTEIEVSWEDNSDNESEFLIEREAVSGAASASGTTLAFVEAGRVGANVTTFLDTGLQPNTSYQYRVTACNQNGCAPTEAADDQPTTEETLVLDDVDVPDGKVGESYSATLTASGGTGDHVWSLVDGSGDLPDGLSLSSEGVISGTPTTPGTFDFTVRVSSGGQELTAALSITIVAEPSITTDELPNGVVGTTYSVDLQAEGGDGSFAFAKAGGSLPPGLTLGAGGTISGTPTQAGSFTFTVEVTSAGLTGQAQLTIDVFPPLQITSNALTDGVQNTAYGAQVQATGGDGVHTFAVISGNLPDGITMTSDGTLSGTPTTVGSFTFTVEVTSGDGQSASAQFTVEITDQPTTPQVTTTSLPDGVNGEAYPGAQLEASGGDGQNFDWAVISGVFPPGLNLATDGTISGTPTQTGAFTFTVEVTSAGLSGQAQLTIDVFDPLQVTTNQLPTGVQGEAYNAQVNTTGGSGVNTFAVTSGGLPDGVNLDQNTGQLTGTPALVAGLEADGGGSTAELGTSSFTITVTSGDGQTADAQLSITIFADLVIVTTSLPDGNEGGAYDETVQVDGGDGDNTFSVSSGGLPNGLGLDTGTGRISGTTTTAGTFTFTITVTSGDGQSASQSLTIEVTAGPPSITTTSFPDATVGSGYSATAQASGGDGSYTWAIVSGGLPPGFGLTTSSGTIGGTPSEAGTFGFTLEVTSAGQTDTESFSITVNPGAVTLETDYLVGGSVGESYSDGLSGSGGDGTSYSFSVTGGSLPNGVSLNSSTGALTGTPTTAAVFYFDLQVTSAGSTDTRTFAVAISANPSTAFNMWTLNVTPGIPSAAVQTAVTDAVARWEEIVTGDLEDRLYPDNQFSSSQCSGHADKLNGQFLDDMVIILSLEPIDGPGQTLGSAGPCSGRAVSLQSGDGMGLVTPSLNTTFGRLRLDTDDLNSLDPGQTFALVFHEIGHIVGYGTWWEFIDDFTAGTDLLSHAGSGECRNASPPVDPRFEGSNGNGVFVNDFGGGSQNASKIPVEADGGEGTRCGHKDEGEFDTEIMTGIIEAAGTDMPISKLTIAMMGDLAYVVDTGAADPYSIPMCSPSCILAPSGLVSGEGGGGGLSLGDDIWMPDVITLEHPDGRITTIPNPRRR